MSLTTEQKHKLYHNRIKLILTFSQGLSQILLWTKETICDEQGPSPITSTHDHIFVYDQFFDLPPKQQMYYIVHQVIHIALRHHIRAGKLRKTQKLTYNHNAAVLAQDLIVDWSLQDASKWLEIPPSVNTFEKIIDSTLLKTKPPSKWTFEEIYKYILKKYTKDSMPEASMDIVLPEEEELSDVTKIENEDNMWEQRMNRAMALSGSCGILRKLINDIPASKTPWNVILKRYLNKHLSNVPISSYARPHKRTSSGIVPFYMPSYVFSKTAKEVAFVVDTSGSISNSDLTKCLSEIISAQQATGAAMRLIFADCAVQSDVRIPQYKTDKKNIIRIFKETTKGGGGTSFIPAVELLSQNPPDVCIYLTDTYGAFPSAPPKYPLIWVSSTESKAPWGLTIHMNEDITNF